MAKKKTAPSLELGLPVGYEPSDGELDNIVCFVSKHTVGWIPQARNQQVCLMMVKPPIIGQEGIDRPVQVTCECLWDHIAGEPEGPTAEQLFVHIKPALQERYSKTTSERRAVTE